MRTITIEYRRCSGLSRHAWCVIERINGRPVKMCRVVSGYYLGIPFAKAYALGYGAEFVA